MIINQLRRTMNNFINRIIEEKIKSFEPIKTEKNGSILYLIILTSSIVKFGPNH